VLGWAISVFDGERQCCIFLLHPVLLTGKAQGDVHGIFYNVRVRLGAKPPQYTLRHISGDRPRKLPAFQCSPP